MMPDEKDRLLALFMAPAKWCRRAEARNAEGEPVTYDDGSAVAWDVTGALCMLFGWPRACALFEQVDRCVHGKAVKRRWPPTDSEMDAMVALQEFNDAAGTTFEILRAELESIPAWRLQHAGKERIEPAAG